MNCVVLLRLILSTLTILLTAGLCAQPQGASPSQNLDSPAVQSTAEARRYYADFALNEQGDPVLGLAVFTNIQAAACIRCHTTDGSSGKAGPELFAIADKFSRADLIKSILEPSASIAVGYDTTVLEINGDEEYQGIIKQATDSWIELMGWDASVTRVAVADITARRTSTSSFMPAALETVMSPRDFANLVAYLQTLHQPTNSMAAGASLARRIPIASRTVGLEPFLGAELHLDHPVWFGQVPGQTNRYVVLEHGGRSWLIEDIGNHFEKLTLVDLSKVVRVGGATGLLGFAFHPEFQSNRRYYLKYQVLEDGVIHTRLVERKFADDFRGDAGEPERELLKIRSVTQDHNGGCIAFGPDGFLYFGMGDTGPQRDPQGHGQDMNTLLGKLIRVDVDRTEGGRPYGIPASNPFVNLPEARPEIWACGFREPWRFSFDPLTGDLWVGDVGQDQFEEVTMVRAGENHGWNVYEGFAPFSERYRSARATCIPPVFSYSHRDGVSVTGGFVYRGQQAPAMVGQYILADFESRRIWALTQTNRSLQTVVEIGRAPTRAVSFGVDHAGEIYLVGYDDGIIYHLNLSTVDPAPVETRVIAETSEHSPVRWRYTTRAPAENWFTPEYDDARWNYGPGGFGTRGTPGAVLRTEWNSSDIWLRREFALGDELAGGVATNSLSLRLHHDEDAVVYLNGVQAARLPRWTSGYVEVDVSPEATRTLHMGRNVMAIHCRQNNGGQYIDAGLIELVRGKL